MSKYDIIIIGSGLGGLECGAILSKEGYNVCVLEKNELFGGCFQTYRRKGHLLDTGIHYIGSLDEGQVMNQFFRYVGIMDHLKVRKLDENAFDKIFYKNRVYDYAMGTNALPIPFANHSSRKRKSPAIYNVTERGRQPDQCG